MPTRTAASSSVTLGFSGSVSEYAVAIARKASSTAWLRSSTTSVSRTPVRRARYQATNTTIDQPMPMSRRLAPVMLASASEHGVSPGAPGGRQAGPYAATAPPALKANTRSTAYSGSTAMKARSAIASPAEMSSCATSAPHDSMNAAPTMARP